MDKEQSATPMIRQYLDIKAQHSDSILFFRLGDFYEMFYEDAELAARELDLVLTSRGSAPMCGVPYHAADSYLMRLVNKGYRVAICEQVEDARMAKGLVRRKVIRVVTPGTIMDEKALPAGVNNYLAAVTSIDGGYGLAWADVSTGEFLYTFCHGIEELMDELVRVMPREILLSSALMKDPSFIKKLKLYNKGVVTNWESVSNSEAAVKTIEHHFGREQMDIRNMAPTVAQAVAMVLSYLMTTQGNTLKHLEIPRAGSGNRMLLDAATRRNLELTAAGREQKREGSLLWVLDRTVTAMGARTLRHWLEQPLLDIKEILERQQGVKVLVDDYLLRQELWETLQPVRDLERLSGRIAYGTAGARDLQALKCSLAVVPVVIRSLSRVKEDYLCRIRSRLDPLEHLVELISKALVDNPPAGIHEGGIIRKGYNEEVDRLREAAEHGREWLVELEVEERERTGIKSLKIGFNRVFGYYIEVTKPNLPQVPSDYQRKQTLANAERFVTPQLRELERQILGAEEKLVKLENQLFLELREKVLAELPRIQGTARSLGTLDALLSLAAAAVNNNYVRPEINTETTIKIKKGRHPVVEMVGPAGSFVPNDTYLDRSQRLHIITGPNMAGKSTYIRQVALIVLMSQVGSYVPAEYAKIGLADKIFTRIGAADDLFAGQSTFMMEMQEVAYILKHATRHSLIILDEVGRGTSTVDGLSIARAVTEYIHNVIGSRTLFATHYHELVELEKYFEGIKNYCISVLEQGEDIIFLRTIIPGGTDKSYGVHVARLAGLPQGVLDKAQNLLNEQPDKAAKVREIPAGKTGSLGQTEKKVLQDLLNFSVMTSTPLEAMERIYQWQRRLKEISGRAKRVGD